MSTIRNLFCAASFISVAATAQADAPSATMEIAAQFITSYESEELTAYRDVGGIWTIGIGATNRGVCTPFEIREGLTITREQSAALLECEVEKAIEFVREQVGAKLPPQQEAALVSLAFNIGRKNFASSTLLRKLRQNDQVGAAAEFHRWVYCKGKIVPGLVRRRAAEANLFASA